MAKCCICTYTATFKCKDCGVFYCLGCAGEDQFSCSECRDMNILSIEKSFIEKCVEGSVSLDKINNYIDLWHSPGYKFHESLSEFLGMTEQEYAQWVTKDSILNDIIENRKSIITKPKRPEGSMIKEKDERKGRKNEN